MSEHRRRGIPNNIKREHVERAIKHMAESGVDKRRE
jgi:hypothetical protein